MKLVRVFAIALTGLLGTAAAAPQNDDQNNFQANLRGFREVPANSTVASGEFKAEIINDTTIAYELTYSGLEAPVTQAHIHFGQRFTTGGITLWLCQIPPTPVVTPPANPADPTGLAPTCPQEAQGGTIVKGSLTAANLAGPAGQGIAGGAAGGSASEFAEILKAIRAGLTYANVHSVKFPSGEIRGQIRVVKDKDEKEQKENKR